MKSKSHRYFLPSPLGYANVTLWQWLVSSRESWVIGHGSIDWLVTWVIGHKIWPVVSSASPTPSLWSSPRLGPGGYQRRRSCARDVDIAIRRFLSDHHASRRRIATAAMTGRIDILPRAAECGAAASSAFSALYFPLITRTATETFWQRCYR